MTTKLNECEGFKDGIKLLEMELKHTKKAGDYKWYEHQQFILCLNTMQATIINLKELFSPDKE